MKKGRRLKIERERDWMSVCVRMHLRGKIIKGESFEIKSPSKHGKTAETKYFVQLSFSWFSILSLGILRMKINLGCQRCFYIFFS